MSPKGRNRVFLKTLNREGDMKKVLIVEDEKSVQHRWRTALEKEGVTVVSAFHFKEAEHAFLAHLDLDAIILDGRIPPTKRALERDDDSAFTSSLVREWRKTFNGPILAASSSDHINESLIKAGCSHSCKKSAWGDGQVSGMVPRIILDLLAKK